MKNFLALLLLLVFGLVAFCDAKKLTLKMKKREEQQFPDVGNMVKIAETGVKGMLAVTKHTADGEVHLLQPPKPMSPSTGAGNTPFGVSTNSSPVKKTSKHS
ncbi:MAG: hypothetical protein EXX96DRAFT_132985 [Benjaminiella poitrasii]|nr:MAG: hypothetical protein EXX96DRAFT_132985 [Benjaminiella poitrasii]